MVILLFVGAFTIQAVILAARWRNVTQDARDEWRTRSARGDQVLEGVTQEQFIDVYRRCHGPRGQLYIIGAIVAAAVATPVIFTVLPPALAVLTQGADTVVQHAGTRYQFEVEGDLVFRFTLFLAMPLAWAAIGFVFAYLYHKRRPNRFSYALQRVKAGLEP